MATEADFLAAIAAVPADATTKLVFADWLEDQGDPRAELVRRLAHFAELYDAAGPYGRVAVQPLVQELAGWFEPVLCGGRLGPTRHGLLGFDLAADTPADDLDLAEPAWGWVGELEMARWATAPEVARLAGRLGRPVLKVHGEGTGWLLQHVADEGISSAWLRWTASLDLDRVAEPGIGFAALLAALPGLRHLRFPAENAARRGELMEAVTGHPLESLTIETLYPVTAAELARLGGGGWCDRLRRLSLGVGLRRGAELAALFADGPLAYLEELRLEGSDLDAVLVRALVDGAARRSLRVLGLTSPALDAHAVGALVECPYLDGLRELSLVGLPDADVSVPALMVASWPRLAALTVGAGDFGRAAVRALLESPLLPRLLALTLHPSPVLAELPRGLAASPAVANLRALRFGYRALDERGLRRLIASPHLSVDCAVSVWGVGAGPATATAFRERFPHGVLRS